MSVKCCACGKPLGSLSAKLKIKDGAVCPDCLKAAGLGEVRHALAGADTYSAADISGLIALRKTNEAAIASFSPDASVRNLLIDRNSQSILIKAPVKDSETASLIRFSQIAGFELVEDHTILASGGAEHPAEFPLPGPSRFGAASTFIHIGIRLENCEASRINIPFLSLYTKHSNIIYKQARLYAAEAMTALQEIYDLVHAADADAVSPRSAVLPHTAGPGAAQRAPSANDPAPAFSAADEIRKFKALLDDGIITEEEFQAKKSQLLNL